MGDRPTLQCPERRLPTARAVPFSAASLLRRIDQIDQRLRQLEDVKQLPESYFPSETRQEGKYINSSLQEVQLIKSNLMERLHLLEARIRQLSSKLGCGADSSLIVETEETKCLLARNATKQTKHSTIICSSRMLGGSWNTRELLHKGACGHDHKPTKSKVKHPKEAILSTEKKTMERTRFYKRWFPIAC